MQALWAFLIAGAASIAIGCAGVIYEKLLFAAYSHLESRGLAKRLMLHEEGTSDAFQLRCLLCNILSAFPAFLGLLLLEEELLRTAVWGFQPLDIVMSLGVLYITDAWFWFVHASLHHFKSLYRLSHHYHHRVAAVSVHNVQDVTVLESFLMLWGWNLALVFAARYLLPAWNPVTLALHIVLIELPSAAYVHCGTHIASPWLRAAFSSGASLLPFAAPPEFHCIHHVDGRSNRGGYLWCWDYLAGTCYSLKPQDMHAFLAAAGERSAQRKGQRALQKAAAGNQHMVAAPSKAVAAYSWMHATAFRKLAVPVKR